MSYLMTFGPISGGTKSWTHLEQVMNLQQLAGKALNNRVPATTLQLNIFNTKDTNTKHMDTKHKRATTADTTKTRVKSCEQPISYFSSSPFPVSCMHWIMVNNIDLNITHQNLDKSFLHRCWFLMQATRANGIFPLLFLQLAIITTNILEIFNYQHQPSSLSLSKTYNCVTSFLHFLKFAIATDSVSHFHVL